jgi:hypothetical protein
MVSKRELSVYEMNLPLLDYYLAHSLEQQMVSLLDSVVFHNMFRVNLMDDFY